MDTTGNLKTQIQNIIAYQDVLSRNTLLAQRTSDQEFFSFLKIHNELRHKYADLRVYADQLDRSIEQYRIESERKDKKIQSQSAQILRLTKHNRRNNERLTQLQVCLDQIKGTITEQNGFEQLREILHDSIISDHELTEELPDENCTGDELDHEKSYIPKVVSQSAGIGGMKQSTKIVNNLKDKQLGQNESPHSMKINPEQINEFDSDHLFATPYSKISVGRQKNDEITSPVIASGRCSSLTRKRPKQKVRRPSREFLNTKSEESELSTDDVFWSKTTNDNLNHQQVSPALYPTLSKFLSPACEEKTLTPSMPAANNFIQTTPINLTNFNSKSHSFVARNILIPETCCVCLKRIHFGKLAFRCQTCNALCHTGCKENCTTLCLPNVKTPNRGSISKFTSRETSQLQIPALLVHCIKEIEQRGLQEVGIYRLNVVESQIKDLKERILKSRNGLFDLSHYTDIHLICGVVKDFLRSLSESLLTNALWKSFASIVDEESSLLRQQKFDSFIQQLPKPNRETLAFLVLHLQRVAASPHTRMTIINLSRTMGPSVIGYSSKQLSDADLVGETYKQTKVLECFLNIPSHYWAQFLEIASSNEATTPSIKQQCGTPILARQNHVHNTPKLTCSAPYTFFSPI